MKTYPDGRSAQTVVSAEVVNDLGAIIDSLRAENARLRAALEDIIDSVDQWARAQGATSDPGLAVSCGWDVIQTARAALAGTTR